VKNIGYVNFSKDDFGYGISYILYKNNIKAIPATIQTAKYFDVLLFSIFWWEHVYDFYKFCIKAGVGKGKEKPLVIVGGFNSFNPLVFMPYAHKVVVGDGEDVLVKAINNEFHLSIYTGIEEKILYNLCDISENDYVYNYPGQGISRIEIARGCKYKCKFCQLTWLKPYREVSIEAVKRAVDNVKTKRVALFAPNSPSHSNYQGINEYHMSKKLNNIAADVRYNEMHLYNNQQTPTIGLEGMSYKLRKSIGKPITNEDFVKNLNELFERQVKKGYQPSVHTYIILDLPGEEKEDFEEYAELMKMVNKSKYAKYLTWIMTGNVFMPGPHTPLENEEIHIDRDYRKIWNDVLSDRDGKPKYIFKTAGRHTIFSPYSRLLSQIATRGGNEAHVIIEQIVANKQLAQTTIGKWENALRVLIKFIDKYYGGVEKYTGKNPDNHWKMVEIPKWQKKGQGEEPVL
jgi:radical SAM superfamily enzyme YgiQ (UPF0313 family)